MTAAVRTTTTAPARRRPPPPRRSARTAPAAPSRAGAARSTAAQRAYVRRSERTERWLHLVPRGAEQPTAVRRVPFVVLVIALLASGLAATLWLTTRAAEDSYHLATASASTQRLGEQAAALRRDVATADSASSLAQRAARLGMVPAGDVAHLVVGPDATVALVGSPTPATGIPVPPLIAAVPTPPAVVPAPTPPAPTPPAPTPPAATPPAATPPAPAPLGIQPGPDPAPSAGAA